MYSSMYAQDFSWTNKCENEKSEAEISSCMELSCVDATKYFENQYDKLYEKVNSELKKAEPNSIESDIFLAYAKFLPMLKKSLSDLAIYTSEIDAASSIGGSGHENIKLEILLAKIESNISIIKKINSELP